MPTSQYRVHLRQPMASATGSPGSSFFGLVVRKVPGEWLLPGLQLEVAMKAPCGAVAEEAAVLDKVVVPEHSLACCTEALE